MIHGDIVKFPTNLSLNMHVSVNTSKEASHLGVIRFIGLTAFAAGVWIGVELFESNGVGKNDGSVLGQRYFECRPNHGIFVREDAVTSKFSYVLKQKLSQMMTMLNEQLEVC